MVVPVPVDTAAVPVPVAVPVMAAVEVSTEAAVAAAVAVLVPVLVAVPVVCWQAATPKVRTATVAAAIASFILVIGKYPCPSAETSTLVRGCLKGPSLPTQAPGAVGMPAISHSGDGFRNGKIAPKPPRQRTGLGLAQASAPLAMAVSSWLKLGCIELGTWPRPISTDTWAALPCKWATSTSRMIL